MLDGTRRLGIAPLRTLLCDLIALAAGLAGVIMLLFSELAYNDGASDSESADDEPEDDNGGAFGKARMTRAAMWSLGALV